jgi:Ran GTPase-activating protein (RanGAP) involved in mRNA processing and transport
LANAKITSVGAGALFTSIRGNQRLIDLTLSENDLNGRDFSRISLMLWNNKELRFLRLSQCNLGLQAADSIGEGFKKSRCLDHLDLSRNRFNQNCFGNWQDCLGIFYLRSLDLSDNQDMGDESVF